MKKQSLRKRTLYIFLPTSVRYFRYFRYIIIIILCAENTRILYYYTKSNPVGFILIAVLVYIIIIIVIIILHSDVQMINHCRDRGNNHKHLHVVAGAPVIHSRLFVYTYIYLGKPHMFTTRYTYTNFPQPHTAGL